MADPQLSRSAGLLERQQGVLAAACAIPFVQQVTDGTLTDAALARYLLVEEAFVLTASRVLGRVVWESATWDELLPHARSLTNLVTDQREYFAGLRGRSPVEPAEVDGVLARAAVLADVVLAQVAEGGRAAAVVGMYAAETMYARWCTAAAAVDAPRQPDLQAWVRLHAEPAFLAQVDALRDDVDRIGPEVPDADLDRWYAAVLAAEVEFHAVAVG
ncbi:TenA family protein [Klenkia brasiliensis]|uniref:Thiaminase (Transcriptional activator TenA) n=1 Tax=Klenkia brasiliensis TaxID=333142 RepID=A0A1G7XGJ6_9ACTN|nr:TenA family protein [Klenkia brasiliensis]SDG83332.1 thiaminase (transcriptional activator TenA) [Klenkia brasiliensis]